MGAVAIFKGKLVKFLAKAGILVPARGTVDRSSVPTPGEMAFNTDSSALEVNNGSNWSEITSTTIDIKNDPLVANAGIICLGAFSTSPSNQIKALVSGTNAFIYGYFDRIQKQKDIKVLNGVSVNAETAAISNINLGLFNGLVRCSLIVGDFIYVGGTFTVYSGIYSSKLVKISLITGQLDPTFNVGTGFNSDVYDIKIGNSNDLYVVGSFTSYNGTTRQRIAKLNAITGQLDTTFDSSIGFNVTAYSIALDNSGNLYVGGEFTTYKGVSRQRIAKINSTNASLDTTFDAASGFTNLGDATIYSVVLNTSNDLYVGGKFNAYKGVTRQRIVKLNSSTAALDTTFDTTTGFDNDVKGIQITQSGDLIVCGSFTSYKGTARQRIAKLNPVDATLNTTFNTSSAFNSTVENVLLSSNSIYAVGRFSSYAGTARQSIAKIDSTTGVLDATFDTTTGLSAPLNPNALSVSFYNSSPTPVVLVFGYMDNYKSVNTWITRQNIAKISLTDYSIDATFDTVSGFDSVVNQAVLDDSGNIYAVGSFTSYKGTARQCIAKINATTGALDTTFDTVSGFDSTVITVARDSSGNIYAGGSFTQYKGNTRQRIAKLNGTTAAIDTTFLSGTGFNSNVQGIAIGATNDLYVIGGFNSYNGTLCERVAKLNATTAALDTTFNTQSGLKNGDARTVILDNNSGLYIGGSFNTYKTTVFVNGLIRINKDTAALDTTFNTVSKLNFGADIKSMVLDSNNNLYISGSFTTYNSITRQSLAKLNAVNATLDNSFDTVNGLIGLDSAYLALTSSQDIVIMPVTGNAYKGVSSSIFILNKTDASITTETVPLSSYTLTAADKGKLIYVNSSTAVNINVPSGLVAGFRCNIVQIGTGQVTIVAQGGVTLNSASGLSIPNQYKMLQLLSYSSNIFHVALTG